MAGYDESIAMFRKIVTWIIVIPPLVILVAFAVANRQAVTVSFDPFSSTAPAYAATLPLFALIFAVLILGVIVGGFAAWLGQGKWRRSARRLDAEARALRQEVDVLKARQSDPARPPTPLAAVPPPAIAPPLP
jgi:uncharacterized integral membrane protein